MKLAIRVLALLIVFAGLAAAKVSKATPVTAKTPASIHQLTAASARPVPFCVPFRCDLW
jgi:hypothetical protein